MTTCRNELGGSAAGRSRFASCFGRSVDVDANREYSQP